MTCQTCGATTSPKEWLHYVWGEEVPVPVYSGEWCDECCKYVRMPDELPWELASYERSEQ